jgi:hypothetical protein
MRRTWEFFSRYILVNEMAQESLDAEAKTILEALRARLAQPEREWQGLTDEEIRGFEIWLDDEEEKHGWNPPADIVKYIEAKLKEKNGTG